MFSKLLYTFAILSIVLPVFSITVRINELGDSITGSPGCWRALLWQKLQNASITNTDFVGTLPAQGCGFPYDGDNDGHGGFLATGIVTDNDLPGWLAISQPDIVTMMLGTNDVWSSLSTSVILQAFTTLIGQMRAQNPNMVIMVAQITPMDPSGCTTCAAGVVALDAAIPAWAAGITTSQSPVSVVDLWTGYDDATDTVDGVHPNDSGNTKIANAWFAPMSAAIKLFPSGSSPATTGTPPTTTTTNVVSPTNTSPTACSASGVAEYLQCGGQGWTGGTICSCGYSCVIVNDFYSQCLQ